MLLGGLWLTTQKSLAIGLNPDPGPGAMPGYVRSYLESANNQPQSPTIANWVSPAGAASATSITVPSGTQTIDLDSHLAGVVGWSPSSTTRTDMNIVGGSPGVTDAAGDVVTIIFNPYQNYPGTYRGAGAAFRFTNATPFTTSTTVYLSLYVKNINEFVRSNGTFYYRCVDNGAAVSGPSDPNCPITELVFSIRVDIGDAPPQGVLDSAGCDVIEGWAFDRDSLGSNLDIHLYFDGPAGVGTGYAFEPSTGYTIMSRSDVNTVYPGVGNNHGFSIRTPSRYIDGNTHTVYAYAIGKLSNGQNGGSNTYIGSKTFGPCFGVSCSVSYPAVVEPGETFSATFTIRNDSAIALNLGSNAGDWILGSNGPGRGGPGMDTTTSNYIAQTYYDYVRVEGTGVMQPGQSVSFTVGGFRANAPTTHTSDFEHNSGNGFAYTNTPLASGTTINFQWQPLRKNIAWYGTKCGGSIRVASKPYLKAYGNDIKAGSAFSGASTCSLASVYNPKASMLTFARNSSTQWFGAGSQLAAFALGEIDGFISAATRSPNAAGAAPPRGLTIGNYYAPASTYGGVGGQYGCMTDYFDVVSKNIGGSATSVSSVNVSGTGDSGQFVRPIGSSVTVPGSTVSGKRAVVIDGDAYIGGNILYGSYSGQGDMPSLYLIVKGNIYIAPTVTQLDGVFVAQPRADGTGGTIYTCANNGSFVAEGSLGSTCASQLTVEGAFLARDVKFLRTTGTLQSSAQNETWSSTNIAEVFKSSAELYLTAPSVLQRSRSGPQGGTTYDSITSLPPIL